MIRSLLRKAGLKIINVSADGDCIFHAVLIQITSFLCSVSLRQAVCQHIISNQNYYTSFIDCSYTSFEVQLDALSRPKHWNSDVGDIVALALCNLLNRRLVILTTNSPTRKTTLIPTLSNITHSDIILFLNHSHYSAIVPLSVHSDIIPAPDFSKNTLDSDFPLFLKSVPTLFPARDNYNTSEHPPAITLLSPPKDLPANPHTHQPRPLYESPTTTSALNANISNIELRADIRPDIVPNNPLDDLPALPQTSHPCPQHVAPTTTTVINETITYVELGADERPDIVPHSQRDDNPTLLQTPHPSPQHVAPTTTASLYEAISTIELGSDGRPNPMDDDPAIIEFKYYYSNNYLPLDNHCSLLFNNFRKMQNKFIACLLHLSTLVLYHQNSFIPRGLFIHMPPNATTSTDLDSTLLTIWNSTLHNTSMLLIEHLINHYMTYLHRLTPSINKSFLELFSLLDPPTYRSTFKRLEYYAHTFWYNTLKDKNRKLTLDINLENNIIFSDTFLHSLYTNPFKHKMHITNSKNFNSPWYNYNPDTSIFTGSKKKKNRRFIPSNKYRTFSERRNDQTLTGKEVVNLSDLELSAIETKVLSYNLQFCPTPEGYNPVALSLDLFKFGRRLRLKEFHYDPDKIDNYDPTDIKNHPKIKQPNHSTPLPGRDVFLDSFISKVSTEVMSKTKNPSTHNLTTEEKSALKDLTNNNLITIKPADKGGAVVIQNTTDYITECNRQLQDTHFYKPIDKDPTTKNNSLIISTLTEGVKNKDIDPELATLLVEKKPTTARFYTVPKIHKSNNPGRPIISGNGCPSEKISIFVDRFLQPLATTLDSYVKDDMDFLHHIDRINRENIINSDTLLVTMDVSALYTNIPHHDGTDACRHFLDTRPDQTTSTDFICKLIMLILTLNNFSFNGQNYLQIMGTAMGTCMAPNYANLFMGYLEARFLDSCTFRPLIWLRYIDDIFLLWDHGKDKLMEFISAANAFHPTIKFTYDISDTIINFLDVTIHKTSNNRLETDLYSKPTNSNLFLHFNSCHPHHTKKSLPYSLAYRLLRICSTEDFLTKRLSDLKTFLLNRNYSSKTIDKAFKKLRKTNRSDTFKRKDKTKTNDRVPLVTTFHPGLPNLPKILQQYLPILHSSERCKAAIPNCPIVSFRRPKSLKDILVRSKVKRDLTKPVGFHKCGDKKCKMCISTLTGDKIKITSTGATHSITKKLNCKSYNVIYLVTCAKCGLQYVGKSETQLNFRVNNHRSFINTKKPDECARHFYTNNHTFKDFRITAIEYIPHADTHILENKETFYIKIFKTLKPHGLNTNRQKKYPIADK